MEIKIIKTFRDGSFLVEANDGKIAVVDQVEYQRLLLKGFDMKSEILKKLHERLPHYEFSIEEEISRDFVYFKDSYGCQIPLTNISIGSLEFWINDQRMKLDEINDYIDKTVLPPILEKAYTIEYERCKDSPEYFFRHYVRVRNKHTKD